MSAADFGALDAAGLNLQAVFDLASLPAEVTARLGPLGGLSRLLLVGHGGQAMWRRLAAARASGAWPGAHPIDDYSLAAVRHWLAGNYPAARAEQVYPPPPEGARGVDLQALGALAGWHHPAPFMVGINAVWGPWFAYRVLMLTDAPLAPTRPLSGESPCASCSARPCVRACPAEAMAGGTFSLARCVRYRGQAGSACALTCRARLACPVKVEHRYGTEQLAHSYVESLRMITACGGASGGGEG